MPSATIDACCLIDLLASGHAQAILQAAGYTWHLPVAVHAEVQYVRQPDPANLGKLIQAPVDLSPWLAAGVLTLCQPDNERELDLFTQYATQFRSDGEAMCVALAEARGWLIATDDRKAIRVSQQAGIAVICCPQMVKLWAVTAKPNQPTLTKAIQDIELLAQFRPNSSMPECQWWIRQMTLGGN